MDSLNDFLFRINMPALATAARTALEKTKTILTIERMRTLIGLESDQVAEMSLALLQRRVSFAVRKAIEEGWSYTEVHKLEKVLRVIREARWWGGTLDGALPEDAYSAFGADLTDASFQYDISEALGIEYNEVTAPWEDQPHPYPAEGIIWHYTKRWISKVVVSSNGTTRMVPVKVDIGSPITTFNDSTWHAFGVNMFHEEYSGPTRVEFSRKVTINGRVIEVHRSLDCEYGANVLGGDFLMLVGARLDGDYKTDTFTWGPVRTQYLIYMDLAGKRHRRLQDINDVRILRGAIAEACGCSAAELADLKYVDESGFDNAILTAGDLNAAYHSAHEKWKDLDLGHCGQASSRAEIGGAREIRNWRASSLVICRDGRRISDKT